MCDRDMELRRGKRAGQCGIGIAVDQHPVRPLLDQDVLDPLELPPGHRAMAPASDSEMVLRPRYLEFVEEDIGHVRVKMLPGVNDDFLERLRGGDYTRDGRRFDELRPRSNDGNHLFTACQDRKSVV